MLKSLLLAMAIAFGRSAALSDSGTTPIGPLSVVINAGETVVVGVTFNPTTCAVTGVTDNAAGSSSVYTKQGEFTQGSSIKMELWSTGAGTGKAATTVSVAFSGTNTDSGFTVGAYTGVAAIGAFASNGGASGTHTISITTQDANNFVVAHFACLDGSTPVADDGDSDTLRQTDADVTVQQGLVDNTAASASSVTCSLSAPTATPWAAGALELRSVGPANAVGYYGTRQKGKQRGPFDQRGFLRPFPQDYTQIATTAKSFRRTLNPFGTGKGKRTRGN